MHQQYEKRSIYYKEDGLISSQMVEVSRRVDGLEKHGIGMFVAWFVVGSLLLITKRYMKSLYQVMHYVHALLGYFTLLSTIFTTVMIFRHHNWKPIAGYHAICGMLTFVGALAAGFSGTATIYH